MFMLVLVAIGAGNDASPNNASANEHQICTFATSWMYAGNVILRLNLLSLMRNWFHRYTLPFVSTTCQCGAGVSGILKSSDTISTSLLPSFMCIAVPVFA